MPSDEPIHVWYHCHHCGAAPIVGRRFSCESCPAGPENDLCEVCHEQYLAGEVPHPAEHSLASVVAISEHRFESSVGCPRQDYEPWLVPPHPPASAPPLPERFVVRPEFRAGTESFIGSYAFVVNVDSHPSPVVLTALHIMDELIGKHGLDATGANTGYTGQELPAIVSQVQLYDVFAANWVLAELGSAAPMLVVPDARIDDEEPFSDRDVAAFWAPDASSLAPGRLAPRPPAVGEPVWLAARSLDRPPRKRHKAVIVEISERSMVYRFEDSVLEAPFSSGAPLLDRLGDVVGVNVGGGRFEGHKIGHANHVDNLRRHLDEGLRRTQR